MSCREPQGCTVREPFRLLIADRNPHVRSFLRREFASEGYQVTLAKDAPDLFRLLRTEARPHLLIVDVELPHTGGPPMLERLREEQPQLPVVLHTFATEELTEGDLGRISAMIEKSGHPDELKRAVHTVLREFYPNRFEDEKTKA